jgi:exopolysaccharide production protein ExoZ
VKTLLSIQVLRAVAALAVVVGHTYFEVGWFAVTAGQPIPLPFGLRWGAAGVDLFFVISGFVMVYASARLFGTPGSSLTFATRRIIRIVPLYWIATTAMLLQWHHIGTSLKQEGISQLCVFASYAFIPCVREGGSTLNPLLGVGWSLNYEMFFYLLFTIAILLPRRIAVPSLVGVLAVFVLLKPYWPGEALRYLASPIVLEFAAGALIALAYVEGVRLSRPLAFALFGAGILGFALSCYFEMSSVSQALFWGGPCAAIVAGAVFIGDPAAPGRLWRSFALLGDASYSLYLSHPAVNLAFRSDAPSTAGWLAQWHWLYVATLIVLNVSVGLLIYFGIERPITAGLRRLLKRRQGGAPQVQAPLYPAIASAAANSRSRGSTTHDGS